MKAIMETAMKNGAMGMTTALIYPPSSYAKTPELIEMAKVAGRYGGIYATHMRDEGKRSRQRPLKKRLRLEKKEICLSKSFI